MTQQILQRETLEARINHNDCRLEFFQILRKKGNFLKFDENRRESLYSLLIDDTVMEVLYPYRKEDGAEVAAISVLGISSEKINARHISIL